MKKTEQEIKEFNKNILVVCDFLIKNKIERSYLKITEKTGVNINYIRDLRNNKSCYSEKFLENLCNTYPVNKDFVLTGEGEMLKSKDNINIRQRDNNTNNIGNIHSVKDVKDTNVFNDIKAKDEMIKHLQKQTEYLQEEIIYLREQNKTLQRQNESLLEQNKGLTEQLLKGK